MKKKIIGVGIILVIVIGFIVAQQDKKSKDLTIGVIAGMTGDYAVVGEGFLNGVRLAQDEWNSQNPNAKIEIVVEDDEFQATKGLTAYKKLMNVDKVDALINMTTFTIDAVYEDVFANNIPVAQGFEQGIAAQDDNVVQLWPGNVPAVAEFGEYINAQGYKKVALVYENSSGFFTLAVDGFKRGYGDSISEFQISSDPVNIRTAALKISESKPDIVVIFAQPTQGSLFVKEIKKLSGDSLQLAFDANMQTGFETYKQLLGDANILNNSLMFIVPNVYQDTFKTAYKQKFNAEPGIGSETGYNTFKLLASTYDSSDTKWIDSMKSASFDGADGKIVFDQNGVRIPEIKIGRIENGALPQ